MEEGERPQQQQQLSLGVGAAAIPASEGPSERTMFNMRLQLQQLQAKVEFLAGGTDGEQLADLLMEKEEEGRAKDRALEEQAARLLEVEAALRAAQAEAGRLGALAEEQGRSLASLTGEADTLTRAREGLLHDLGAAHARAEGVEAEKAEVARTLKVAQETLAATRAALARREAAVGELEEARRRLEAEKAELARGKEEAVGRLRSVKAGLEQQLGHERTRYSLLEGQLQVGDAVLEGLRRCALLGTESSHVLAHCNTRPGLPARAVRGEGAAAGPGAVDRGGERAGAGERTGGWVGQPFGRSKAKYSRLTDAHVSFTPAQERGRLEARATALGDENRSLHEEVQKLTQERRLADSVSASHAHKAAKLEQEAQALQRERERAVAQARASEAQWRERLAAEQGRAAEALAEAEARATMVAEEGRSRRAQLEGQLTEMAAALTQAADRALAAEEAEADLRTRLEAEQQRSAHWQRHVQEEASVLRRELADQRRAIAEAPRLRQENQELREKVQRQEAYLRRRIVKERAAATGGSTGDPGLVTAARAAASEIFASLDAHAVAASPRQYPAAAATAALVQAQPKAPAAITAASPRASAALTAVAALMGSPSRAGAGYATPSKASSSVFYGGGSPARLLLALSGRGNKENHGAPHLALPSASPTPAADPIAAAAAAMERLGMPSSHLTPSRRDGLVSPPPPAPAGAVARSGYVGTPTSAAAAAAAATTGRLAAAGPSPARLKLMADAHRTRSPGSWR